MDSTVHKNARTVLLPRRKKILDIRNYIIPSRSKKKTRWSERIDEVLYGKK